MDVKHVLGDMPLAKFIDGYLYRLPLALSGSAINVLPLGGWETLGQALSSGDADVLIVRDGERYAGAIPTDLPTARRLSDEGYTIVVRHTERHHPELAALAAEFTRTFHGPVDVQMFVTPPGKKGFSWHYDAEDVFIIQTAGQKEYSLRKNTVNPWPLEETLPADMRYEREIMPLMTATLHAGDLLYIPCGYWHKADSTGGDASISLAVGVMTPSAIDVFDSLRPKLLDSLLWRQRLPLAAPDSSARPDELRAIYREILGQLAADLVKHLEDESSLNAVLRDRANGIGEA